MKRLTVTEHHSDYTPSEIVRIDLDVGPRHSSYKVVAQYLGSKKCMIVDIVRPDDSRERVLQLYVELP